MSNKRKIHCSPPAGVKSGDIHNGRTWALHPTKGYRCVSAGEQKPKTKEISKLAQWFGNLTNKARA